MLWPGLAISINRVTVLPYVVAWWDWSSYSIAVLAMIQLFIYMMQDILNEVPSLLNFQ
jgi:hypothetical protein